MPFHSSGKFRTNAQKKRIDVWLIYRCTACGETWNRPILERQSVGSIPPHELHAFAINDPAAATRHAFDLDRLARHSNRLEQDPAINIDKRLTCGDPRAVTSLEITIALVLPCRMRLDGVLSRELRVPRSLLHAAHESAALSVTPAARKALRSPIVDGQRIWLDLESTTPWSTGLRNAAAAS